MVKNSVGLRYKVPSMNPYWADASPTGADIVGVNGSGASSPPWRNNGKHSIIKALLCDDRGYAPLVWLLVLLTLKIPMMPNPQTQSALGNDGSPEASSSSSAWVSLEEIKL